MTNRARLAKALDAIVIAIMVVAIIAELAVDVDTCILGRHVTLKATWRIVLWAVLVATVRHLIVRRPSLLQRVRDFALRHDLWRPQPDPLALAPLRAREIFAVLAFYSALTVIVLWDQVTHPFAVPDPGDPLFVIWRMSWIAHQLNADPAHLFDANIFHPQRLTLAYSDASLVSAIFAVPLAWLGVHQVIAYTITLLMATPLAGLAVFLLVRSLVNRSDAALVSGLLFTFCAFRFSRYSQLEYTITHWAPLALYFTHRAFANRRWRDHFLTGLVLGLQALTSLYYGLFLATFLAAFVLALIVTRHARFGAAFRHLAFSAAVAVLLALPVTIPYWEVKRQLGERSTGEVRTYSAVPADYLSPSWRSVYAGHGRKAENAERELFPGFTPITLAVVGLWPPLSPMRVAYGLGLAFAVDASMGLNGEIYYWMYELLPPIRGVRVPARFAMLVVLILSVLAGFGVARIVTRLGRASRYAVVAVLAAISVIEARPILALETLPRVAPSVYQALPTDHQVVLADLPFPGSIADAWMNCHYLYFSTFHWHRLVNGYSGAFPPDFAFSLERMKQFPSDDALAYLRGLGVEYVVIHQRFYGPTDYTRVVNGLAQRSDVQLVTTATWEGHEARLYQLR